MATGGDKLNMQAGGLLSYFTRHKTASNLLLVLMLVAGFAAMPNMRAQFFPDVVVDDLTVSVAWSGAGAEDVDAAIVQFLNLRCWVSKASRLHRRRRVRGMQPFG